MVRRPRHLKTTVPRFNTFVSVLEHWHLFLSPFWPRFVYFQRWNPIYKNWTQTFEISILVRWELFNYSCYRASPSRPLFQLSSFDFCHHLSIASHTPMDKVPFSAIFLEPVFQNLLNRFNYTPLTSWKAIMVIFWKLMSFEQISNTLVQMTILRSSWMSASKQSRYNVHSPRKAIWLLTQGKKFGGRKLEYTFSAWSLGSARLLIYSTKNFFWHQHFLSEETLAFFKKAPPTSGIYVAHDIIELANLLCYPAKVFYVLGIPQRNKKSTFEASRHFLLSVGARNTKYQNLLLGGTELWPDTSLRPVFQYQRRHSPQRWRSQ